MQRLFISPESDELLESGAVREPVLAGVSPEQERALLAPLRPWLEWGELGSSEILRRIGEAFSDRPEEQREVLARWMAEELGYRRWMRRGRGMVVGPLWVALTPLGFARLGDAGWAALEMIANAMRAGHGSFHPMAALATVALWLHSPVTVTRQWAWQMLGRYALPDDPAWLYALVGELMRLKGRGGEYEAGEGAVPALVRRSLEARFWGVGALLAAMHCVRRYAPWRAGHWMPNLLRACDAAAVQYPQANVLWIQAMAEAAVGGGLTYAWLEQPVAAAIRLSVGDRERQAALRAYHQRRPYDADHRRLEQLHGYWLRGLSSTSGVPRERAQKYLWGEVRLALVGNAARAQRLLEWMVVYERGRGVGSVRSRLDRLFAGSWQTRALTSAEGELLRTYVRTFALEPHAVGLVSAAHGQLSWGGAGEPSAEEVQDYLVVGDYERAFSHLTTRFDGVALEHADAQAAARLKGFVERRLRPGGVHRLMRHLASPRDPVAGVAGEVGLVSDAVERGLQAFERRIGREDLGQQVLEAFRQAGVSLGHFEEISRLAVERVDDVLRRQRQRRVLMGAVAGGISGSLAPLSWGVLSMADIPIVLGLTADICSRFCWYYGFDPRQEPELPLQILAVALGGSQAAAIEPMLVRQNLREQVLHKSLLVGQWSEAGALRRSAVSGAGGPDVRVVRAEVRRNLARRAVGQLHGAGSPWLSAALGATLNAAFLYDICEAAQAVLTDRFLERKYPEWLRQLGPSEDRGDSQV